MSKIIKPLDWSREVGKVNYCGYCIDYTCGCDGSCFKNDENKREHLKDELKRTKERLAQLRQESIKLK